jgi:uncharacterized protein YndB with AHSA1/START domain
MTRTLRREFIYPKDPPQRVWVALTDPRALAEWLMPNTFQPVVGHLFIFQVDPMPLCGHKTECEVVECDPPRRPKRLDSTSAEVVAIFLISERRANEDSIDRFGVRAWTWRRVAHKSGALPGSPGHAFAGRSGQHAEEVVAAVA